MRADQYLVQHGYYESRANARAAIDAGCVRVNGQVLTKPSAALDDGADIQATQPHPWVSRGGLKLDYAVQHFKLDCADRVCLDIGASTGGFTDVLLSHGAAKVFAVDVGRDQLHEKLRDNPKVIALEQTDARNLTPEILAPLPSLIVCDASFISATKVLKTCMGLVEPEAEMITLVKPQFEVGKEHIGKGGIVRDQARVKRALTYVADWVGGQGWQVLATDESPIKGGDGNTEFLLYARKRPV